MDRLDTEGLRKVRDGMTLLTGQRQRASEPPKPPPPEPIDDLLQDRDGQSARSDPAGVTPAVGRL